MKALIADDVVIMRKLLKNLLSEFAKCDLAMNGKEVIQLYKSSVKSGQPYDLICLDIMMPVMNGLEVLKEIRDLETEENKVKIVMTTGISDKENVAKAIQYGCDGYLTKPYDKHSLKKQLIKLDLL